MSEWREQQRKAEKQPRQVLIKNLMKRSRVKIAKLKEAFY